MKQTIYKISFATCFFLACQANAQVVLNEIYADPSNGNQEFFEFYNINTSNTPASVDNYTVISYFEEGSKKGFYVLDLPNLFVASKGYFVGASSIPFNYQGNLNSTGADFSWNDPSLSLNYGYMKKWVSTGNTSTDGNKNYDEEVLPVDFNDLFKRKNGGGASYNAFVFKNGKFVNSFFGGTGGDTNMPSFITSMPAFKLEIVTAAATTTTTLNFNSLKNKTVEYVTQDIGTDNGFMKTRDGFCGTWTKSSSTAFHTPQVTNGSSGTPDLGSLTLDVHLYNGPTLTDPSFIVYNITAGPTDAFPVELQVYLDNGNIEGVLDSQDEFVTLEEEKTLKDGPFTTYLPQHEDVLIIAKTDAGCIDQIAFAENPMSEVIALPIKLLSLQGGLNNNEIVINWSVAENESGHYFQVEKSLDGKNFIAAGMIFNTAKKGNESYSYKEAKSNYEYYRLKVFNKDQTIAYSKIIVIKTTVGNTTENMRLLQNPVQSTVNFNYESSINTIANINIYTITGTRLFTTKAAIHKGSNAYSLDISNKLSGGTYILELQTGNQKTTTKFIKQ